MFHVFEQLLAEKDIATCVALGLTCNSLYAILKSLHPEPIKLRTYNVRSLFAMLLPNGALLRHVAEFLGPGYRMIWTHKQKPLAWRSGHFLNKKVYFREGGLAEARFQDRMLDYLQLQFRDPNTRDTLVMLPCPLGKGEDWYEDVF